MQRCRHSYSHWTRRRASAPAPPTRQGLGPDERRLVVTLRGGESPPATSTGASPSTPGRAQRPHIARATRRRPQRQRHELHTTVRCAPSRHSTRAGRTTRAPEPPRRRVDDGTKGDLLGRGHHHWHGPTQQRRLHLVRQLRAALASKGASRLSSQRAPSTNAASCASPSAPRSLPPRGAARIARYRVQRNWLRKA